MQKHLLNEFLKNKINIIGMDKSEYAINLANAETKDKLKIHDIINGYLGKKFG